MVFIDLEKAYDSIPQCIIWAGLEAKGVSRSHIEAIRDMFDGASTNITYKNTFYSSFTEFLSLVVEHSYNGPTKIIYVWLSFVPKFIRSFLIGSR